MLSVVTTIPICQTRESPNPLTGGGRVSLGFRHSSINPGALFGLGAGYSWVFATISIGALIGIFCWLFIWRAARDRWLTTALGLVTAGIIGNLYDRLGWGYVQGFPEAVRDNVRDWILFRLEGVPFFDPWPNFNIADSLLVIGAILLFLHAFFCQGSHGRRGCRGYRRSLT